MSPVDFQSTGSSINPAPHADAPDKLSRPIMKLKQECHDNLIRDPY